MFCQKCRLVGKERWYVGSRPRELIHVASRPPRRCDVRSSRLDWIAWVVTRHHDTLVQSIYGICSAIDMTELGINLLSCPTSERLPSECRAIHLFMVHSCPLSSRKWEHEDAETSIGFWLVCWGLNVLIGYMLEAGSRHYRAQQAQNISLKCWNTVVSLGVKIFVGAPPELGVGKPALGGPL